MSETEDPDANTPRSDTPADLPGLPGLDAAATKARTGDAGQGYLVLARKYRPGSFATLIGQEAMVRTLSNAIAQDRLAHAFLLTGVRGVGKTSTARLIAKALNCIGPDGKGGPTIDPCGACEHCRAISESRHMDVLEMDAASRTGVDDVREIIDAVRYAAVSARTKIYIIDEVHMLTKNAFNALLKTLEEPPPHVTFIFATTEIRKVPVTVLSRCQRFDLKRIPADTLAAHFADILGREGASADADALGMIARAAEGSVRDGLSILDQAIAHSGGAITAAAVRDMLGLADRTLVLRLLSAILQGDAPAALANIRQHYDGGADPAIILQDLLDLVHATTEARLAGANAAGTNSLSAEEAQAVAEWAQALSFPKLHRLWQMLLKGLAEVQNAPVPVQAAEMAVLRLIHASGLPDPEQLVRLLTSSGEAETPASGQAAAPGTGSTAQATAGKAISGEGANIVSFARRRAQTRAVPPAGDPPHPHPHIGEGERQGTEGDLGLSGFAQLVGALEEQRALLLARHLRESVRLVTYAPPTLVLQAGADTPQDLGPQLSAALREIDLTAVPAGTAWKVQIIPASEATGKAAPTLRATQEAQQADLRAQVAAHPLVAEALRLFPQAELTDITEIPATPAGDTDTQSQQRGHASTGGSA